MERQLLHQVGHPPQNANDIAKVFSRARWAQRLAALDRVGGECVAFDNVVLDLCRLEINTSCLMF